MMTPQEPAYLGDGLYAVAQDGFHIELKLNSHLSYPLIFINEEVAWNLILFLKKAFPNLKEEE